MTTIAPNTYTAFNVNGHHIIAYGTLESVALAAKEVTNNDAGGSVLIFDNLTGRLVDIDLHGTDQDVRLRLPTTSASNQQAAEAHDTTSDEPRGRGRPKLGVVAREVTLLPRHWDWLAAQPGGASVALRRLVDEARRANSAKDRVRMAQDRAYRFMSAIAGDFPNFEEACRALFAYDQPRFKALISVWPDDVCAYVTALAFDDFNQSAP